MKVYRCIFLFLIIDCALSFKGRKCVYPYKKFAKFKLPFRISYQQQENEFDLADASGGNSIFNMGLGPRFRSGAVDITPIQVSCQSANVTSALKELRTQIKCIPRDSIVRLKAPIGFVVSPNVVMVKKCGGMCNGAMHCISKTTRDVTFFVRSHNMETNEVICSSILVPEDATCKCGCRTKITDCLPSQKYDKSTCSCKCINVDEYDQCVQKNNPNIIWDEKNCRCVCDITNNCTTGSHWVPSECRCAKIYT